MIRQVGPYSTLITPQAGSLFHAEFQAIGRSMVLRARLVHCEWPGTGTVGGRG
jgi:hypothetical protein